MGYIERVNCAIDYMIGRLDMPLRLNEVARAAKFSPFHFQRIFQSLMGETPADFVKRLRLDKALFMMAHGKRQLTSIALTCGFASSSDFSRAFKQRFGTPPSRFDLKAWRDAHAAELQQVVDQSTAHLRLDRFPGRHNPDGFKVKIRELPARTVAYIRVHNPYRGNSVITAYERLMKWAEANGLADSQWLGYQWENPEITALEDCRYHVAVVAERFTPQGEIGRFRFPPMVVAQIEIFGGIDLELRALQWLYGTWLPRSGFFPDDLPGFEAWIGRPFGCGLDRFKLNLQLPVTRSPGRSGFARRG